MCIRTFCIALLIFLSTSAAHASHVSTGSSATLDELLNRISSLIGEMEAIKKEVATLTHQTTTSAPSGAVLGAATAPVLTLSLEYGVTNDDIARIQKLLATDPEIYPYGVVSGFFGPKTQEAIRNLQGRFDLDTVGVIGPATTALLEAFFAAYPDENYPAGVLDTRPEPRVAGTQTSTTHTPTTPATGSVTPSVGSNPFTSIEVVVDRGEGEVEIEFVDGRDVSFVAEGDSESELTDAIARRLGVSRSLVAAVVEFDTDEDDDNRRGDADEDDAEDALDEADEALDDADDEIDEADDEAEDVDWAKDTLREADDAYERAEKAFDDEDWDDAVRYAEDAIDLAKKAEDRIGEEEDDDDKKGDLDEIESIEAEIEGKDDTDVTVEYEDGSEYEFNVEEDKVDEIIEEIAKELDMDEDDVEDLIEFDFGTLDDINVTIEDDEAEVRVRYESGVVWRFVLDEDNENDLIEEIAEKIDEDEEDVEAVIDFDYN